MPTALAPQADERARSGHASALRAGLRQKQWAVAGVIAGRLSLLEAAAWFRAAGAGADPRPVPAVEAESLCRSVSGWVQLALSGRAERAEAGSWRRDCAGPRHPAGVG